MYGESARIERVRIKVVRRAGQRAGAEQDAIGVELHRADAIAIRRPGFQYNRQRTDKSLVVGRGEHLNGWHSVHRVAADRRGAGQRLDVRGNGLEGVIARADVRPGKEIVVAPAVRGADHR